MIRKYDNRRFPARGRKGKAGDCFSEAPRLSDTGGFCLSKVLKKLFGSLNLTWPKIIIAAVICGVYTGVMAILPFTKDTSFRDITTSFECWVLFGILIIVNSKSPWDSALKTFVFFLISQPLVYLVQVPFYEEGWKIFIYYPPWFYWTLLTFPMALVGYFMKKDKWWGLLILAPMLLFVGYHFFSYFGEAVHFFPQHLLTSIFCAVTMILYPLFIFNDRRIRVAGLILSLVILLAAAAGAILDSRSHTYDTSLLVSGGETVGIEYDESYQVYLEDESFGTVWIEYEDSIECCMVKASFKKTGDTGIVLVSPTGEKTFYDLTVERTSYEVHRRGP